MKTFYFDTETTGLDPKKNSIIQIAGIIVIDGEVKEEFNLKCKPIEPLDNISNDAIAVHGMGREEIATFPDPEEVYITLNDKFDKYIDKFNRNDKFIIAGQNVGFDLNFLIEFWKRQGDTYLGSYLNFRDKLDLLPLVSTLRVFGFLNLPDSKLGTIASHFNIQIDAHDALSDIKATRLVLFEMLKRLSFRSEV